MELVKVIASASSRNTGCHGCNAMRAILKNKLCPIKVPFLPLTVILSFWHNYRKDSLIDGPCWRVRSFLFNQQILFNPNHQTPFIETVIVSLSNTLNANSIETNETPEKKCLSSSFHCFHNHLWYDRNKPLIHCVRSKNIMALHAVLPAGSVMSTPFPMFSCLTPWYEPNQSWWLLEQWEDKQAWFWWVLFCFVIKLLFL